MKIRTLDIQLEIDEAIVQEFRIKYRESKFILRNSFWDWQIITDLCVFIVIVIGIIFWELRNIYFLTIFSIILPCAFWVHLNRLNKLLIDDTKRELEIRSLNPVKRFIQGRLDRKQIYSFAKIRSVDSLFVESFAPAFESYFLIRVTLKDNTHVAMLKIINEDSASRVLYLLAKIMGVPSKSLIDNSNSFF